MKTFMRLLTLATLAAVVGLVAYAVNDAPVKVTEATALQEAQRLNFDLILYTAPAGVETETGFWAPVRVYVQEGKKKCKGTLYFSEKRKFILYVPQGDGTFVAALIEGDVSRARRLEEPNMRSCYVE
jgi:hypothetical protein